MIDNQEKDKLLNNIWSMTVCIAALSDDKKKAVLVADKLLTNQGVFPVQFNGDGKIFEMNENVKVMYSGGSSEALSIIDKAKKSIGSKKWILEVAEHINQKHLEYLQEILIRQHLIPRGIKTIDEYYKGQNFNIDQNTKNNIDIILTTHSLINIVFFIVCGKDSDGTFKIYLLNSNPRFVPSFIHNNYTAIGSGANHALFSIMHSEKEYNQSLSLEEVKKILLEAKKKAEKAPDVGKDTDVETME